VTEGASRDTYGGYRARLVEQLRAQGIRDLAVLRAFAATPRHLFVPEAVRHRAYEDAALPIGVGQTISQPFTQARYLEALGLSGRERVLEIGTGSGYQTALLAALADQVFTIERMRPLAALEVTLQISLDSAEPELNDEFRAPHNFEKVVAAVPRLVELGIPVRIATTGDRNTPEQMERLCALHRSLGVPDEDHVVRPIVRRGRAIDGDMGVVAEPKDLFPELTLTADGAFWSPFGPTVHAGRLDTDLLVTRQRLPLDGPARALLAAADANPEGHDATLNIR